jgi:hypothetical protein
VVNAVNDWMNGKPFDVSEGCWIYKKP